MPVPVSREPASDLRKLVGDTGIEPVTSSVSKKNKVGAAPGTAPTQVRATSRSVVERRGRAGRCRGLRYPRGATGEVVGALGEVSRGAVRLFRSSYGSSVSESTCLGRTTVKCCRSRVATSVSLSRSATAITEASVVPKGRLLYVLTSSAIRA